MAKMIKSVNKALCKVCGEEIAFARVVKSWADASNPEDRTYKGMVRRCKCGTLDKEGRDISKVVG